MQATDKPSHSSQATHEMVGEEALVINLNSGSYYELNDTGARFWQLIDGQRTITDCARLIAADYEEVDIAEVEADLLELAAQFQAEGLIVI